MIQCASEERSYTSGLNFEGVFFVGGRGDRAAFKRSFDNSGLGYIRCSGRAV